MTLSSGDPASIGGHRIVDRLGTGGMGTVFLGRSPSGREVAVKLVHEQYASDPTFRTRFRQEVAAARRVSGAFTAAVVDADPEAERPWMATQYVPGPTLAEQLHRHGPLSMGELRQLALGLVEALRDIHRAGVIHRDLKPGNVLMASDGPRVIDFGISRAADHQTLTMTGHVMGTPPFMSPEQLSDPRTIGPSSDVFSLAALLVYAAVGRGPFDADSPYMTAYQVVHEPPDLDEVPEPLRGVLDGCLTKEPQERPPLDALERQFLGMPGGAAGAGVAATVVTPTVAARPRDVPPSPVRRASSPVRRASAEGQQDPAEGQLDPAEAAGPVRAAGGPGRARRRVWAAVASVLVLGIGAGGLVYYLNALEDARSSRDSGATDGRAYPPPGARPAADRLPPGWRPWQAQLPIADPSAQRTSGPLNIRCATAGSATYCGGVDVRTVRLDQADGRIMWQTKDRADGPAEGVSDNSAPFGATTDTVLVSETDGNGASRLVSLAAADGHRLWERPAGSDTYVSGAVLGRLAVGPDARGEALAARDVLTGATKWTSSDPQGLQCQPRVLREQLYGVCEDEQGDGTGRLTYVGYDPATGKQTRIASYGKGYDLVGEANGRLVFAKWRRTDADATVRHGNRTGEYAALVLRDPTGARPAETVQLGDYAAGGPSLFAGTLYFVQPSGIIGAVSVRDGRKLWRIDSGVRDLGVPLTDRDDRHLFVPATDGRVLALDLHTGGEVWRSAARGGAPVENSDPVAMVRNGGALVVTRTDRTVFGIVPEVPPPAPGHPG
ncbi:protein kinase [Streptomyces sp. NPDC051561]|uniref:serine/threonine-protein kinase n=1 Tax=Streptomyces sp. NPDC051561 TaxID=3365658 RepID=UPI0037BC9256